MKGIMVIIMMLVFFGLLIGANIYLANRFGYFIEASSRKGFYIFFAATTVFMFGGIIAFMNSTSGLSNILYISAATLLGFFLYLLISTILVDVPDQQRFTRF